MMRVFRVIFTALAAICFLLLLLTISAVEQNVFSLGYGGFLVFMVMAACVASVWMAGGFEEYREDEKC